MKLFISLTISWDKGKRFNCLVKMSGNTDLVRSPFVDEREIKGSEDRTMEGKKIEEGTSSEVRKNLGGGMVTN